VDCDYPFLKPTWKGFPRKPDILLSVPILSSLCIGTTVPTSGHSATYVSSSL